MDYTAEFAQERVRLVAALGEMADGGMVENCVHVGATAILQEGDCVDLAVCGYPLASMQERLTALGYSLDSATQNAPVMEYVHASGRFRLFIAEAGSPAWSDILVTRAYVLQDRGARDTYRAARVAWARDPARKQLFFENIQQPAQAWWVSSKGFAPVQAIATEVADLKIPWYVASGWALDLYLGRATRVHHDLDIQIAYADQFSLREYLSARGWKLVTPFNGKIEIWGEHLRLEPPRHQIHAHRDGAFLDILLSDVREHVWRYRREPFITAAIDRITLTSPTGIPFLAPEIVLLFKSRNTSKQERPQDETDFERVAPALEPERRAWLRWALLVTDSAHPWLAALG